MVIFIDDKLVRIVNSKKFKHLHGNDFDIMIDARLESLSLKKMCGHVIILNASEATIEKFFNLVQQSKEVVYQSVTLVVGNKPAIETQIKNFYKVVKQRVELFLMKNKKF